MNPVDSQDDVAVVREALREASYANTERGLAALDRLDARVRECGDSFAEVEQAATRALAENAKLREALDDLRACERDFSTGDKYDAAIEEKMAPRYAALDAIASELKAERIARQGTLAELERVQAERDHLMERAGARVHENVHADVQARLDRAVEALRAIERQAMRGKTAWMLARAALAEIEESG